MLFISVEIAPLTTNGTETISTQNLEAKFDFGPTIRDYVNIDWTMLTSDWTHRHIRKQKIDKTGNIDATFLVVKSPPKNCRGLESTGNRNEHIKLYEHRRLFFGAKSSPLCAIYALHQVTNDNAQGIPQTAKLVTRNFYMDHFVSCVPSVEQAIETPNHWEHGCNKNKMAFKRQATLAIANSFWHWWTQ